MGTFAKDWRSKFVLVPEIVPVPTRIAREDG